MGTFSVVTDVNRDATAAAIGEILGELERYDADGMTDQEFALLHDSIGRRDALAYEASLNKRSLVSDVLIHGLPNDYRRQQQEILRSSTRSTCHAVTSRVLAPR